MSNSLNYKKSKYKYLNKYPNEVPFRGELLNSEQLALYATKLAEKQEITGGTSSNYLLDRLNYNDEVIKEYNNHTLSLKPSYVCPATEWMIDNFYLIEEHIQLARRHLPKKYSKELPCLSDGPYKGLPRVYELAVKIISHEDAQLDEKALIVFFKAYQEVKPLKLGELWAIPIMLRLVLIENLQRIANQLQLDRDHRDMANEWMDKLEAMGNEKSSGTVEIISDMAKSGLPLSSSFVAEFYKRLSIQNSSLGIAKNWIEQRLAEEGLTIDELVHKESQNQAADQVSVSHSIKSLRFLNDTDWKDFIEAISLVEEILRNDPIDIYGCMDFSTRDHYRHVVESLASRSRKSEIDVAQRVVDLAEKAHLDGEERRCAHVGYYLIGDGADELADLIGIRQTGKAKWQKRFRKSPLLFYGGSIIALTIIGLLLFIYIMSPYESVNRNGSFFIFFVSLTQITVFLVNWLSTLIVKPDMLPRLDFSKEINPDCRTLVVIPTMISSKEGIDKLISDLEIHYLSNRDNYLHFGLLTDFTDSKQEKDTNDNMLLEYARTGISALNEKYTEKTNGLFFLFHRPRKWNPKEKRWMGYERKRGKLMALNAFLKHGFSDSFSLIEGNTSFLTTVKYVITLDTDTQLPPESAYKLIGTMAHPLNHPVVDFKRNVVVKGYGILQPRVAITLSSSQRSLYSRLFTDDSGIDPYTRTVSDVYQDIFHEGSFVGKGIYDVETFTEVLGNRFPENKILSHDLLESTYIRSGLVSDVEIFEPYPSGYNMDVNRRHRWIRGDWQIIQWLFSKVPTFDGGSAVNPISMLGRWKIADNLRRSLVPLCTLLFFIGFCILFPQKVWAGVLILLGLIILPFLFVVVTNIIRKSKDQPWSLHLRETMQTSGHHLQQTLFSLVTLPYDAYYNVDAIIRSLWRLIFSHKYLLQWQTSEDADRTARNSLASFYASMWFSPAIAIVCGILLGTYNPILLYTLPFLVVWILAPYIAWYISRPIKEKTPELSQEQKLLLHRISRKTWYFFETFVNEKENWLPPDNFQEIPEPTIASRTSPTNIGMSLLANLAAYDMGYLSAGELVNRTNKTFSTLTNLKKFRGHLYNWYDTRTLEPLFPLYVSSVDSGNLAGHLLTLCQGLRDLKEEKVYAPVIFEGLLDTTRVMRSIDSKNQPLRELEKELTKPLPQTLSLAYILLNYVQQQTEKIIQSILPEDNLLAAWGEILKKNVDDHINELLYLVPWIKIIHTVTLKDVNEDLAPKYTNIAVPDFLEVIPTLQQIADLEQTVLPLIENILSNLDKKEDSSEKIDSEKTDYYTQWLNVLKEASDHAKQRIHILDVLAKQSESFAKMDFEFLYDTEKKLFTIGYNVVDQRKDSGSYDMLASEARLCSYVAIAQGQIPQEHWFSLSRLLFIHKGRTILLSWSGSMFEYLMSLLVMPDYKETLFDQTYKGVVQEQIEYGRKFNVPWGISESGLNRTDTQFNYQYKAFGIPSLGLKRGLSRDLVIAPYATLLALMVSPKKACDNMQRLSHEGHEGVYGYYEAIDYTPSHLPPNESQAQVRSFMAHHQGMGLLAMVNLIKDNLMQKRFISCPMLKAYELLLQERIPHSITANVIADDSKFEIKGAHPLQADNLKINRLYKNINTIPEINILSNGRYRVMINNLGAGYSRWNNLAVTRWREDGTCDNKGLFIYLKDIKTDKYWSVGYQPTLFPTKEYEVHFTQAYAAFRQRHTGLEIHTTICVSPEDDVELRCIKITNHSRKVRTLELTTYSEVVIDRQEADESHPVFNNLFVQTNFKPELSAVFCTRRARSEDETPPFLFHLMLPDYNTQNDISCETDRAHFIGRGNNQANPAAMQHIGSLSGSEGSVLDPVISLRRTVTIAPGQSVRVCIALGMAETKETALALAEKYQNTRMTDRAFELAWTHSQVILYNLNITEAEAQLFAKLSEALVYMDPLYRADPAVIRNNKRGQNNLWGYGISGDVPIVLVKIEDMKGIELVRQMVLAHAYWRVKGLTVELVILNEDTSVYRQPLHSEIINTITTGVEAFLLEKPGGIFVRPLEQMPGEDVLLLHSVARLVFSDKQGTLYQQVDKRKIQELRPPALQLSTNMLHHKQHHSPELPARDLAFYNGCGGFTRDGKEYVITLNPGEATPMPWSNVIANTTFGTVVTESGGAYTWAENAHEFRLTPWNNDTVQDTTGEAIYIRDEYTGKFWSPTPLPAKGATPYVIRHGFGYTVFEHTENGIYSELWIYVAIDAPVKFSVLKIKNISGTTRKISVAGYYEWVLGDKRSKNQLHIRTEVDMRTGILFARNYYNVDFSGKIAFIDIGKERTVTGDRKEFIGQNGSMENPLAMKRARLSGRTGAGFDPCGAVHTVLELAVNEEKEVNLLLGYANHKEEMQHLVGKYRQFGAVRKALEDVWEYWNRTLGTVNVDTPDSSVNVMANGWLLYQTLSSRIWGRSGFYQSGGAFGFRDQLQDVMALVYADPVITRRQILLAARHQFAKGDVQHWWHPPTNRGVRTHFSDDYLWLPYVTCRYVNAVGDTGILDETIHFIEGRELRPEEESYYDLPIVSDESATLYEHCVRSIRYGLKFGRHGLPLMGCGDWNDGMNLVGIKGEGESVWLAFFLYDVLKKFSEIALIYNDKEFSDYCLRQAEELRNNIRENAWDGNWYRRAYFDNGEPLGSSENEECYIDSLPQSWSVISGAGDKEKSEMGMSEVDKRLVDRQNKLIRLFETPFDKSHLNPGYIKGYIPGVRENGGQYTHGAIWTALAFALKGDGEKAWELFDLLNPVRHGDSSDEIKKYKVEPYVIAADVYTALQHPGRGGWTWYTGSASWMYRLLVETLLGVDKQRDRLLLSPIFRKEWNRYTVHYRYLETVYHIAFNRINDDGIPRLLLDGEIQKDKNSFLMINDQIEHFVEMWI
jgi:cellobiose phosphorylase